MDKDGYNDTRGAYERGFIDGMQKQAQSSVDRAVNAMTRRWQGLTDDEIKKCATGFVVGGMEFARAIEHAL